MRIKIFFAAAALALMPPVIRAEQPNAAVIIFQPSHQTDTSKGHIEAESCSAIAEYAMKAPPRYEEYKVWSYNQDGLHHSRTGTNTMAAHTSAVEEGRISGYAWELKQANGKNGLIFISLHHNAGTGRHAIWGYVHDGDPLEAENRLLSDLLLEEIARATDLENRGTYPDSSTGRNDYRCSSTGRLAFYSLDENMNRTPYRILLEIGDMDRDGEFLAGKLNQKVIGYAIKAGLRRFLADPEIRLARNRH